MQDSFRKKRKAQSGIYGQSNIRLCFFIVKCVKNVTIKVNKIQNNLLISKNDTKICKLGSFKTYKK